MGSKLDPGFISRRQLRPEALAVSPVYMFVYEVTLPGHFEDLGGQRRTFVDGGSHIMTTLDPDFATEACRSAGVVPSRTPDAWS